MGFSIDRVGAEVQMGNIRIPLAERYEGQLTNGSPGELLENIAATQRRIDEVYKQIPRTQKGRPSDEVSSGNVYGELMDFRKLFEGRKSLDRPPVRRDIVHAYKICAV